MYYKELLEIGGMLPARKWKYEVREAILPCFLAEDYQDEAESEPASKLKIKHRRFCIYIRILNPSITEPELVKNNGEKHQPCGQLRSSNINVLEAMVRFRQQL